MQKTAIRDACSVGHTKQRNAGCQPAWVTSTRVTFFARNCHPEQSREVPEMAQMAVLNLLAPESPFSPGTINSVPENSKSLSFYRTRGDNA